MDDAALLGAMQSIDAVLVARDRPPMQPTKELATARLERGGTRTNSTAFFLPNCRLQLYAGDTALHVAAATSNVTLVAALISAGADVAAANRRRAQPLHAAVTGGPGNDRWDPDAQAAVIAQLIAAGADPDAVALGGVTPLHRAVRNRCSQAVRALLAGGADPRSTNDAGSTPIELAAWTTGRPGSGSPDAKREQAVIVQLLTDALG